MAPRDGHLLVRPRSAEAVIQKPSARASSAKISPQGKLIKSVPCFPLRQLGSREERGPSPGEATDGQHLNLRQRNAEHTFRLYKRGQLHEDVSSYTFSQPGLSAAVSPTHLRSSSAKHPINRGVVAATKEQVKIPRVFPHPAGLSAITLSHLQDCGAVLQVRWCFDEACPCFATSHHLRTRTDEKARIESQQKRRSASEDACRQLRKPATAARLLGMAKKEAAHQNNEQAAMQVCTTSILLHTTVNRMLHVHLQLLAPQARSRLWACSHIPSNSCVSMLSTSSAVLQCACIAFLVRTLTIFQGNAAKDGFVSRFNEREPNVLLKAAHFGGGPSVSARRQFEVLTDKESVDSMDLHHGGPADEPAESLSSSTAKHSAHPLAIGAVLDFATATERALSSPETSSNTHADASYTSPSQGTATQPLSNKEKAVALGQFSDVRFQEYCTHVSAQSRDVGLAGENSIAACSTSPHTAKHGASCVSMSGQGVTNNDATSSSGSGANEWERDNAWMDEYRRTAVSRCVSDPTPCMLPFLSS
jgi:hypothetical protein